MGDGEEISVGAYLRDLRWMAPVTLVAMLIIWALDRRGGGTMPWWEMAGLWAALLVGVGPLAWLRWMRFGAHSRRAWLWLLGAIVWAAVVIGAVAAALSAWSS